MLGTLLRRKSVDLCQADADRAEHRLKRSLGVFSLTALGIGAVIGAGIFSSPGTAAAGGGSHIASGPALMVSYFLVAVACGFAALCYAEMASMVPVAGSAYTYAYVTLGEFVAWIIGWDLVLEYAVGNVAVAVSWAEYFKSLLAGLGLKLPAWMSTTIDHARATPGLMEAAPHLLGIPIVFNLPAGVIIAVLTVLLVLGVQESARVNTAMVLLKLVTVVGFVAVGAFYVVPTNWQPFAPNGLRGILSGASLIFFAYIGFDAVSTTAEEADNPQRDIPRAMIATLAICTVLYVLVTAVLTGMVPWQKLGVGDPLALALQTAGLQKLAGVLSFGSGGGDDRGAPGLPARAATDPHGDGSGRAASAAGRPRSTHASGLRTSPPSSPASASVSRRCSWTSTRPSNSPTSGPCSPSCWSPWGSSPCAAASPTVRAPSAARACRCFP